LHSNDFGGWAVVGLTPTTEGDSPRTKFILSVGAFLAAAVVLAGCGGSGSVSGTTGGVAGARHAQSSGNFRASVRGFETRLQASVHAIKRRNLRKAIASGGPILNDCMGTLGRIWAAPAAR